MVFIGRMVDRQEETPVTTQPSPAEAGNLPAKATSAPSGIDVSGLKPTEKSWGDRFKKKLYDAGTYAGINYLVNTIVSVALAYKFELKYRDQLNQKSQEWGTRIAAKIGSDSRKMGNAIFMGIKGFTLTMGGTGLLPVIKALEDHKRNVEFKIGHGLDVLQETLGKGNSASAQNIADYKKVKTDRKHPGSVEFTAEEKERLWHKHRLEFTDQSDSLKFKEHKLPWSQIIAARAAAWVAAIITNSGLGYIGLKNKLKQVSPSVSTGITKVIPSYAHIQKPDMFTENILNDAILTVSSSVTHRVVQGKMHKDIPDLAPVEKDEVRSLEGLPTSTEIQKRKKLLAEGKMDHRTRAETSSAEPSPAL